jgi:hypothetical protein
MSCQAGPGVSGGDLERSGPAGGGSRLSDADIVKASIRGPSRFGEIFDRYADDILRYGSAGLGVIWPPRHSWGPSAPAAGMTCHGRTRGDGCTASLSGRSVSTPGLSAGTGRR